MNIQRNWLWKFYYLVKEMYFLLPDPLSLFLEKHVHMPVDVLVRSPSAGCHSFVVFLWVSLDESTSFCRHSSISLTEQPNPQKPCLSVGSSWIYWIWIYSTIYAYIYIICKYIYIIGIYIYIVCIYIYVSIICMYANTNTYILCICIYNMYIYI